ncbi:sigmaY antisigma factor component [Jeotgalibacillus sp. R-1-5s-1]|uniref:sigmaY antisigma factor component n=1 Tax=Jeotgalibacillus sp. R-1-5s-1 TaxID=2555897 RepID=UPI00106D6168|nr:sigmaY antisigma factor component [Jeotgalibacillus sp. R-1-5s-1]TFD96552.1 sigmaY antisigma factor component [Jeotgalibacillus sp. R-1-5s-1]
MNELPDIRLLILLILIVLAQSIYLFTDARKRGHAKWFWGIWGIIQTPLPLICYLVWSRKLQPYLIKRRDQNG